MVQLSECDNGMTLSCHCQCHVLIRFHHGC